MAEPTPDKKLLEYLSQFGIGNYQRIDLLLKELFPGEENLKGFLSIKATANIWAFLLDLKNNEFIKYHSDLIKGDDRVVMDIIVKAAIQLKGMEFLKRDFPTSGMNISGQHVNVISHSPSSRIEEKNTNRPITNITNPISPRKKSFWVIVISIITIAAGIVTIQQGWFPNIFKSSKNKNSIIDTINNAHPDTMLIKKDSIKNKTSKAIKKANSTITKEQTEPTGNKLPYLDSILSSSTPPSLDYINNRKSIGLPTFPRNVTDYDIQEIKNALPLGTTTIMLKYQLQDEESVSFAKELSEKLKGYEIIFSGGINFSPTLCFCKFEIDKGGFTQSPFVINIPSAPTVKLGVNTLNQ